MVKGKEGMEGGGSWKEGKAKEGMEGGEMMEGGRTRKGGGDARCIKVQKKKWKGENQLISNHSISRKRKPKNKALR